MLRHVFHVDVELIATTVDLLRTLLILHGGRRTLPPMLAELLVTRLRRRAAFGDWPLDRLLADRDAFLTFLQERWPRYVAQWTAQLEPSDRGARRAAEAPGCYAVAGPADLPFGDDEVRPYVDTLFLEGLLTPVEPTELEAAELRQVAGAWLAVGVRSDPAATRARRLERLLGSLEGSVPGAEARHQEWLTFARTWAELKVLQLDDSTERPTAIDERGAALTERVDGAFVDWVGHRYTALYSQVGTEPVMVHHIARAMARRVERSREARAALVVLDGLALDQWAILREVLLGQRPDLALHEGSVFAWVPTITSVSRQSIFAGKPPMHFPASIRTTSREPALWAQFWADNGLAATEVGYLRGLGNPDTLEELDRLLARPHLRAAGLVVDTVDSIMHGMQLGAAGMHNQVRQWAEQGLMAGLLDHLCEANFEVFLTADHGNVEAAGCGNPAEAALAVSRGERVRVYAHESLRAQVKARFPAAVAWSPVGLPTDYLPLLAPGRAAFIADGERRVSHGGISLEEVIVPFVRIGRSRA